MIRKTFHIPGSKKNEWFRVRQEKDKTTMTYKRIEDNSIDGVVEVETIVGDLTKASEILELAGLTNTSTQENRREVWQKGEVEVCLDTWPGLTPYIEIEAPNQDAVESSSKLLGFDWSSGIFGGSEVVYEKQLGIPQNVLVSLSEISFSNPPRYDTIQP